MAARKSKVPARKRGPNTASGSDEPLQLVRQFLDLLEASELSRIAFENAEFKVELQREASGAQRAWMSAPGRRPVVVEPLLPKPSAPVPAKLTPAPNQSGTLVTSPFVGTFYRSPSPDQPSYVDLGASVKKGQILCIVEAMKLMNEIETEVAGKIVEILAENAQPVEFGQPLFRIEAV